MRLGWWGAGFRFNCVLGATTLQSFRFLNSEIKTLCLVCEAVTFDS